MLAIDLQWAVYIVLLLLAAAVLFAVALDRRRFRHPLLVRSRAGDAEMGRLLDAAPFGLMLLDENGRCSYANNAAGELLSWPLRWGRLPDVPWRAELLADVKTARAAAQPHYRTLHLPDGRSLGWWVCPLPELTLLVLTDHSARRAWSALPALSSVPSRTSYARRWRLSWPTWQWCRMRTCRKRFSNAPLASCSRRPSDSLAWCKTCCSWDAWR